MASIIQVFQSKGISGILSDYRIIRDEAEAILEIEGKTIRKALMEQTSWQSFYDQKKAELKSLMKFYNDIEMGPVKGAVWRELTEESNVALSLKDKEYYLRLNSNVTEKETVFILLEELYLEFESICNAFRARGYALKHISELMVAQIEENVI